MGSDLTLLSIRLRQRLAAQGSQLHLTKIVRSYAVSHGAATARTINSDYYQLSKSLRLHDRKTYLVQNKCSRIITRLGISAIFLDVASPASWLTMIS